MPTWFQLPAFLKPKSRTTPAESLHWHDPFSYSPWWGSHLLENQEARFWKIGQQMICLDRYQDEWHIAHWHWPSFKDPILPIEQLKFKTFVIRNQTQETTLKPILADRPIVTELERPLYIPGGEKILLYVSSPLWCRVTVGKSQVLLEDVPGQLLSDTWFGQNTLEGELCYADHTLCSPHLTELKYQPERILSPLLIKNKSNDTLILKQIVVPVPYLSVYADTAHRLWSEMLIIHRNGEDTPEVRVIKGAPKTIAGNLSLLTHPRLQIRAPDTLKHLFFTLIGRPNR